MTEFDPDHNHDQEGRGLSRASRDYRHTAAGLRGFETTPYSRDSLVSVRGPASLRRIAVRIGFATAIFLQLGAAGARAEELKMTIDNFTFTPPELQVKVGDTVTWTNHDDIPHTRRPSTPTTASPSPSQQQEITSIFADFTRI